MAKHQAGILAPIPSHARYLTWSLNPGIDPKPLLDQLRGLTRDYDCVVGLGQSLIQALGAKLPALKRFPSYSGPGFEVPATPSALWVWLRGEERGELVHLTHQLQGLLAEAFNAEEVVDAFRYGSGFDLTGYEDGTENPEGDAARAAALVRGGALDGSSFVAVQMWVHDLAHFQSLSAQEQDTIIGRRKSDNQELSDAPRSAHVVRTAQESFSPEAFLLRRSMPWADAIEEGLMFVAFGHSLDAFEAQLKRMAGAEDGVADALFHFSRPVSGRYFWCPPIRDGRLDLKALGL